MKLHMKLLQSHGPGLLREMKAGIAPKSRYQVVKGNGKDVLLWTGSCHRLPKKSQLVKRTREARVKRAVVLCPPTSLHLYTVTLDRDGDWMKEVASKAFRISQ